MNGWGFQPVYTNPYYVAPTVVTTTPVYNYSQPIVVNNYSTTSDDTSANNTLSTPPAPAQDAAYGRFDEALQFFKAGNFRQALVACDDAIAKNPNDSVMHEVRALTQFALGQYASAAAVLNSLLASSPGMDWTTMSSLYDDVDTYTEQLRRLEDYCQSNANDAPAQFVLAYHYMVAGYSEEAADVLKVVVKLQPKDIVAQRMLESLDPASEDAASENSVAKPATPPEPKTAPAEPKTAPAEPKTAPADDSNETQAADQPQTDLVGSWKAVEGEGTVTLEIGEDFTFQWKAMTKGQTTVELKGDLVVQGAMMILNNPEQGNLTGRVTSGGANQFIFAPTGAPADYQGLKFERVASSK